MSEDVKRSPVVKMIAEREIKDSMADPRFYEKMPEFLPLRSIMRANHDDLLSPKGCMSCAKHRVYRSVGGDYLRIVDGLSKEAGIRLRAYFGADELRATVIDPATRQPRTIKI